MVASYCCYRVQQQLLRAMRARGICCCISANRLPSSYLYRQVCKDCAALTLSNSKIHVNCKLKTYYSIFYFIHENVIYDKPEKLQVCTMHAGWVFTAFYIKVRTVWMNLLSYIHSFTSKHEIKLSRHVVSVLPNSQTTIEKTLTESSHSIFHLSYRDL